MSRVKGGTVTHARHKKIVDQAKGYYGRRKNTFKVAAQAVDKANQYATRDRHNKREILEHCGSRGSMLLSVLMMKHFHIVDL